MASAKRCASMSTSPRLIQAGALLGDCFTAAWYWSICICAGGAAGVYTTGGCFCSCRCLHAKDIITMNTTVKTPAIFFIYPPKSDKMIKDEEAIFYRRGTEGAEETTSIFFLRVSASPR